MVLEQINSPADLRPLSHEQLETLAREVREFIVNATSVTGGHLGSNLGVVELTLALHRVFDSPTDIVLWDTGHQAYVHKICTGRTADFVGLRQPGGLSGYPNRSESPHDWIENSHTSTVLSYAHGWAEALKASGESGQRRVVAVIGDGSMTGGMAYEALNNLGHTNSRVLIVLNDNGRSYAPTVSKLVRTVSRIRSKPGYVRGKRMSEALIEDLPLVGRIGARTVRGVKAALREMVDEPPSFFESLGVRYLGPIDGHDLPSLEESLRNAAEYDGAIVVHVLTQKGRGYSFAEDDDEKHLHDVKTFDPLVGPVPSDQQDYTSVFSAALLEHAAVDSRIHAITAAMPGPTGLLAFEERFPDRFHDVGIAEQHAVTLAAGMALGGLRPVVAVYSTFLSRAFDQVNLDVGLHRQPVVFALDRAGITGDDGPSHHGVLDLALLTKVPGMTVLAPSSAQELRAMLAHTLTLDDGPVTLRYPKGAVRQVGPDEVGSGLRARRISRADSAMGAASGPGSGPAERALGDDPLGVCILAVGKLVEAAELAGSMLRDEKGIATSVWDVRCVKPLDLDMVDDASAHRLVVTVEDGVGEGGAGALIATTLTARALELGRAAPPVLVLGVPVEYLAHGKPQQILTDLGLDAVGIAATAAKAFENLATAPAQGR